MFNSEVDTAFMLAVFSAAIAAIALIVSLLSYFHNRRPSVMYKPTMTVIRLEESNSLVYVATYKNMFGTQAASIVATSEKSAGDAMKKFDRVGNGCISQSTDIGPDHMELIKRNEARDKSG